MIPSFIRVHLLGRGVLAGARKMLLKCTLGFAVQLRDAVLRKLASKQCAFPKLIDAIKMRCSSCGDGYHMPFLSAFSMP